MPTFRDANVEDVPAIVGLYADDSLGSTREVVSEPVDDAYLRAFRQIEADPRTRLIVVEDHGALVATLQLSFLATSSSRTANGRRSRRHGFAPTSAAVGWCS